MITGYTFLSFSSFYICRESSSNLKGQLFPVFESRPVSDKNNPGSGWLFIYSFYNNAVLFFGLIFGFPLNEIASCFKASGFCVKKRQTYMDPRK